VESFVDSTTNYCWFRWWRMSKIG